MQAAMKKHAIKDQSLKTPHSSKAPRPSKAQRFSKAQLSSEIAPSYETPLMQNLKRLMQRQGWRPAPLSQAAGLHASYVRDYHARPGTAPFG